MFIVENVMLIKKNISALFLYTALPLHLVGIVA